MSEQTATPQRRIGLLIWLILSQLLALGSLIIWAYLAGMSVFAFDEGGSPLAWTIVISVWAYPLFPLFMAIGAWIAFGFRKNRTAAVLTTLTFAPLALLTFIFWISYLIGPI